MTSKYRIGVDIGGTNTDAVLISLDPVHVLASHKTPTTLDLMTGMTTAVRAVLEATGSVSPSAVGCVIVGTTHFVNAIVQRSPLLRRVGVVRLCGGCECGFGRAIPPFADFPPDLRAAIQRAVEGGTVFFVQGGFQITGDEISSLDKGEIRQVASSLVKDGISDVVIAGMYAPLNSSQEIAAAEMLKEAMMKAGAVHPPLITLSHTISGLGFLERENAAILNATLRPLARKTIAGFERAMHILFSPAPYTLYLTQNDGSVLNAAEATALPVRTFNSGPTNSIRGGEFLWRTAHPHGELGERKDPLVVIDIGGTTSDSGLLLPNGLPQMSSVMSLVGGVRTNFALPAVQSIGLGGGSVVQVGSGPDPTISVGPSSVALELTRRARLFGGDMLTATDIAVVAAAADNSLCDSTHPFHGLGDPVRLSQLTDEIPAPIISRARATMWSRIEDLVERTKIARADVDVLIVGGGAPIIDLSFSTSGQDRTQTTPLYGVRTARTVQHGEVANAVGAAISRVSGVVDVVIDTSTRSIREAQEMVCKLAMDRARAQGARPETVSVAEVTILPIQYVEAKARFVVRAVGELDIAMAGKTEGAETIYSEGSPEPAEAPSVNTDRSASSFAPIGQLSSPPVDLATYRPLIRNHEWIISPTDLSLIAAGCKILGCGGGGDPYQEYLKVKALLADRPGSVRVVSPNSPALPDHALVGTTGCMGSPEVSLERLENGECQAAHAELVKTLGLDATKTATAIATGATTPAAVDAFVALEIGGGNGLVNLGVAAAAGVPTVDADYMGRAYPTVWQLTSNAAEPGDDVDGRPLLPMTVASGDGSVITMTASRTDKLVDRILRAAVIEMGCSAGVAIAPRAAAVLRRTAVEHSVSLAWWVGRAAVGERDVVARAEAVVRAVTDGDDWGEEKDNMDKGKSKGAIVVGWGKVVGVERVLKAGHTYGVLEIEGAVPADVIGTRDEAKDREPPSPIPSIIRIPFKNENAFVEAVPKTDPINNTTTTTQPQILVSVPDLIAVLDAETGAGLGTPEYKYGLTVTVIAIAASPRWTGSVRALALGGPGSMGFGEVEYRPIGRFVKPRGIVEWIGGDG